MTARSFLALAFCLFVVLPVLLRAFVFVQELKTFHSQVGWKAENFFKDPQVISLCRAVEANDLVEIDRLAAAGADVNAVGKGGMTPLLWAFPDNKLERFEKLLELGADPNVRIKSDLGAKHPISEGCSVTHLAAETRFEGHFAAVMKYGAEVDLKDKSGRTALYVVIGANIGTDLKRRRVKLLIEGGADLDAIARKLSPTMLAVRSRGQYELALILLEHGASPIVTPPGAKKRLVHVIAEEMTLLRSQTEENRATLAEIIKFLEDEGESLEQAEKDLARWQEEINLQAMERERKR